MIAIVHLYIWFKIMDNSKNLQKKKEKIGDCSPKFLLVSQDCARLLA